MTLKPKRELGSSVTLVEMRGYCCMALPCTVLSLWLKITPLFCFAKARKTGSHPFDTITTNKKDAVGSLRKVRILGFNLSLAMCLAITSIAEFFYNTERPHRMIKYMIPVKFEKGFKYEHIIADASYESEENYSYLENHCQLAFIKPATYERSKTRKYQNDISLRENMAYDATCDAYTCAAGRKLVAVGTKTNSSASGYESIATIYQCENCNGCELKVKCIKSRSKKPLEERNKSLYVSKNFFRQRAATLERIRSVHSILLHVNRFIQVEEAFGVLKEDMGFRRFLIRGKVNVKTELTLLCWAYNIL